MRQVVGRGHGQPSARLGARDEKGVRTHLGWTKVICRRSSCRWEKAEDGETREGTRGCQSSQTEDVDARASGWDGGGGDPVRLNHREGGAQRPTATCNCQLQWTIAQAKWGLSGYDRCRYQH